MLGFDDFAQEIVVRQPLPWDDASATFPRPWEDADDIRTAEWLQLRGINVAPVVVSRAVGAVARELAVGDAAEEALRQALALGGAVLNAEALGAMEEALRMTTEYLRTREQFGRPLASFQALTHRAADMYAQLELARSATLYAAMVADEDPIDVDAIERSRAVVDKSARLVGQEAVQMHGGIGVTAEYPVGHLTARLTAISRTWGTPRARLSDLGTRVADHADVDVLA